VLALLGLAKVALDFFSILSENSDGCMAALCSARASCVSSSIAAICIATPVLGRLFGAAEDSARFTDVPSSSSHGLDYGTISLYLSVLEPGTWEYFPRGTLSVSEFRNVALGRSGLTGGELFNSS